MERRRIQTLRRHWFLIVITLGIAAGTLGLLLTWTKSRAEATASLVLAADSLPYRTITPRLSGNFSYRPLKVIARGEDHASAPWKLYRAAEEAQQRADEAPTPASLHAFGVAQLLLGQHDAATSTLERAVILDGGAPQLDLAIQRTNSGSLLNDLACGYLSRARSQDRASDLLRALPVAERAWQLDRTNSSAWNRALALESLHLNREAAAAWQDYGMLESSDAWRNEALSHEHALTAPTQREQWAKEESAFLSALHDGDRDRLAHYTKSYASKLMMIGAERLAAWGSSSPERSQPASAALGEARLVAEALVPVDPFLYDAVSAIDDAVASNDRERLALLIEGSRLLNEGKRLYQQRNTDDGLHSLRRSITAFERASSCMSIASRILAASCLVFAQRYEEAAAEIARVTNDPLVRHRYPRVQGQSEWIAGLCHLATGQPYEALQAYSVAMDLFERLHDVGSLAALEDLEGEAYEHLGLAEESWRHRYRALELKALEGDSGRAEAIFGGAARAAVKLGQYAAALRFVESIIRLKTDDPFALAELLVLRGAIRQRLGSPAEAMNDFRDARAALARLPSGGVSEAVASDIRAVELLVGSQTGNDSIVVDAAIIDARKQNNKFRLVPLLRHRAASARPHDERIEDDTDAALGEMERQVSTIKDEEVRLTAQRSLHDLYTSLTAIAISRRDFQRAMRLSDCERERSRLGDAEITCGDFSIDTLPADVAVLDYSVINDEVFVVSLHGTVMSGRRLNAPASSINVRSAKFVDSIRNGDDAAAKTLATDLYADLVAPVIDDLQGATTLVIAGSPARISLPFSALWSRRTARYLIEDWTIIYTPGISRLIAAIRRDGELLERLGANFDVLTIAPKYNGSAEPNLPPLPAAQAEAASVARIYRRGTTLTGNSATRASFTEFAMRSTVVHFAGHSITNQDHPRYAALALSGPDSSAPAMFYAYAIAREKFRETRLVVLASCSSAMKIEQPTVPEHPSQTHFSTPMFPGSSRRCGPSLTIHPHLL